MLGQENYEKLSWRLSKKSKSAKNRNTYGNENSRTTAKYVHAAGIRIEVCAPRRARTRFIGAWPSFGKVSWVNCKCFRQRTSPRWLPFTTGGEFVYASWLPTWERQHGARHGLKRTNRLGLSTVLPICREIQRNGVLAFGSSSDLTQQRWG